MISATTMISIHTFVRKKKKKKELTGKRHQSVNTKHLLSGSLLDF